MRGIIVLDIEAADPTAFASAAIAALRAARKTGARVDLVLTRRERAENKTARLAAKAGGLLRLGERLAQGTHVPQASAPPEITVEEEEIAAAEMVADDRPVVPSSMGSLGQTYWRRDT